MDKILSSTWVIHPDSLITILNIMDRKLAGEEVDLAAYGFEGNPDEQQDTEQVVSPVGVLNISGPIFPKATLLTQMSGATSIEALQQQFRSMVADPAITSIVMNIDSPGGMSDLVMEMGDEIFGARGTKPIVAVANTQAASAAYWLGSQADKFYVTPSGSVGSVGVYTVHQDKSKKDEQEGISTTLISAGKYKVEGSPYGPLSSDAKEHMQERVDDAYADFVGAVARGRGVDTEVVKEGYGNGRSYGAKTAEAMGLVDGVQTFDSVLGGMMEYSSNWVIPAGGSYTYGDSSSGVMTFTVTPTGEGGEKMEFNAETLDALGLSENATPEEIETSVMQLVNEIAPLRAVSAQQQAFADQFPEQARLLNELRERDLNNSAKLFSDGYAKFSADSKHGFSAVALQAIEDAHKQVSTGSFSHDDLRTFLDLFSTKAAVVDYTEHGTSREAEQITAENWHDAGQKLNTLAHAAVAEAGGASKLSFGDALAKVAMENPDLAQQYRESLGNGGRN